LPIEIEVEQDEVRPHRAEHLERCAGIRRAVDGEAAPRQRPRQHLAIGVVVIDDQQALCRPHCRAPG
jgi:hypothetical protein